MVNSSRVSIRRGGLRDARRRRLVLAVPEDEKPAA